MSASPGNKHASRSARTRRRFIEAAQRLFAERSIDSVSVNEITLAAGQKNRNALRYHFGNREGLVQAIIDQHAKRVLALRAPYLASAEAGGLASLWWTCDRPCQAPRLHALTPPAWWSRSGPGR